MANTHTHRTRHKPCRHSTWPHLEVQYRRTLVPLGHEGINLSPLTMQYTVRGTVRLYRGEYGPPAPRHPSATRGASRGVGGSRLCARSGAHLRHPLGVPLAIVTCAPARVLSWEKGRAPAGCCVRGRGARSRCGMTSQRKSYQMCPGPLPPGGRLQHQRPPYELL